MWAWMMREGVICLLIYWTSSTWSLGEISRERISITTILGASSDEPQRGSHV